ncbi:hypothetical protein C7M84_025430, partial [Penaeus vannamei]
MRVVRGSTAGGCPARDSPAGDLAASAAPCGPASPASSSAVTELQSIALRQSSAVSSSTFLGDGFHLRAPTLVSPSLATRRGETIRGINQQTGAHCELDRRPPSNPSEKTFIIRGSPEQIDNAKKLIAEKAGGGPGQNGNSNLAPQGWGNAYQQWNQGHPNDPTKQAADANAAAWAAYYSQYYGGQQNQSNQSSAPTNNQPQPNASQPTSGPAAGGQPDYSAQWADYYRSMGMHREAEAIEQQAKGMKVGGPASNATPQQ